MIINNKIVLLITALLILASSCRKSDIVIDDENLLSDDGSGTGTITWTKDKNYILDGFVFVNPGQTLTIEPGTVIRAKTGQGEKASALIVARGGKIIAQGTKDEPIIFTVEDDDLEGSVPLEARGLWGGIIILGNAQLNTEFNEARIEGIPLFESRGIYGGNNNNDNSGILKYVSIRHGGTNIGDGNEINGLTLGGVGSGTTIENVEVISNEDDGFEFFGGNVNCKYLVSAFCGDDAFDFDQGYRGKGQFFLAIQAPSLGDHLAEHDGGTDPVWGEPLSIPEIYNATYIGNGILSSAELMTFADNAGGKYYNSIFINQTQGVLVEYITGFNDSYYQFISGNLKIENNIFYNIENNLQQNIFSIYTRTSEDITEEQLLLQNYFEQANNLMTDPQIEITETEYHLIPQGEVSGNLASYPESWFEEVNYKGAFDPAGDDWINGWTLLSQSGKIK
ncbi:MAG: hypothetical protein V2I54_06305 [Bacteroidales bacterium]|jgi:hypothetical protein|nr:hypothetical protein [Bacteroidales bacterium]